MVWNNRAELLDHVSYRVGVLAALRSACVGQVSFLSCPCILSLSLFRSPLARLQRSERTNTRAHARPRTHAQPASPLDTHTFQPAPALTILSSNRTSLFHRPPLLQSRSLLRLLAQAVGVMVTASHNPGRTNILLARARSAMRGTELVGAGARTRQRQQDRGPGRGDAGGGVGGALRYPPTLPTYARATRSPVLTYGATRATPLRSRTPLRLRRSKRRCVRSSRSATPAAMRSASGSAFLAPRPPSLIRAQTAILLAHLCPPPLPNPSPFHARSLARSSPCFQEGVPPTASSPGSIRVLL
eukprot:1781-Rhodomonas_salina.1